MDNDHYHNILSEEFPSPIRNHDQLPGLPIDEHPTPGQGPTGQNELEEGEGEGEGEGNDASVLARNIQSIPDIPGSGLLQGHSLDEEQHDNVEHDTHSGQDAHEGHEGHGHIDHDGQFEQNDQPSHDDMEDRRRIGVKWSTLTNEEKKERQRAQNRRAAERSRQKRKEEVDALEVNVAQLNEENARLKAKLAELRSTRSDPIPVENSTPAPAPNPPAKASTTVGVDHEYLRKIQSEIFNTKKSLLEKELAIAKTHSPTSSQSPSDTASSLEETRKELLTHYIENIYLKAETTCLELIITQVTNEKDEITRQTELLERDVTHRKMYQQIPAQQDTEADHSVQNNDPVGVGVGSLDSMGGGDHGDVGMEGHETEESIGDRSMLDIGGYIDAAWQASGH